MRLATEFQREIAILIKRIQTRSGFGSVRIDVERGKVRRIVDSTSRNVDVDVFATDGGPQTADGG